MTLPSPDEIEIGKLDAAEIQLERAIELFMVEKDYISALTLAGAADELLGGAIKAKGWRPSRSKLLDVFPRMLVVGEDTDPPEMTEKEIGTIINEARNWLKHYDDGAPIVMNPKNEAIWMLQQAVDNYFRLNETWTEKMEPFAPMVVKRGDDILEISKNRIHPQFISAGQEKVESEPATKEARDDERN